MGIHKTSPSGKKETKKRRNFPGKKKTERKIFRRDKKWKIQKKIKAEREVYKQRENGKYKKRKRIIYWKIWKFFILSSLILSIVLGLCANCPQRRVVSLN